MRIDIAQAPQASTARFIARLAAPDAMPEGIEPVLAAGAKVARFAGKSGQIHEGFVERGGEVVRVALVGIGDTNGSGRLGSLEKAGAALTARYLTSGDDH